MRFSLVVGCLVAVTFAGCLDGDSKPSSGTDPTGVIPRFTEQLPPVYVSTDEFFEADYAAPDFPRVVQILTGGRGAEPNIGVTSSGAIFVTAFDSTLRSQDSGRTWENVYEFELVAGSPLDPYDTSDPMLWVDTDTDRIFTNHMFPVLTCSNNIISDDDGETWLNVPMSCGTPVVDHQKIMTARPALETPMPVYQNLVYYCYNKLLSTNCAVSYDGGIRFQTETVAAGPDACGGINGHPAAALDGTVYVPLGLNCDTPTVSYTTDNGLTWTVRSFGTTGVRDVDPDMTVTPDGTAYYYSRGGDGGGYLYRSKDRFENVDGPFRVSPPDVKGVIFAGITSGDDGRIAMSYLGSREWSEDPSEAEANTTWHLFITHSFNAADPIPVFQTQQVTPPNDPVQVGCVWVGGGGNPCRNMLDFIDMVSDKQGRIHVAFTDGCTARTGCADNAKATPDDSRDRMVSLAIQDHGPGLIESIGLLETLGWTTQVNDPSRQE